MTRIKEQTRITLMGSRTDADRADHADSKNEQDADLADLADPESVSGILCVGHTMRSIDAPNAQTEAHGHS